MAVAENLGEGRERWTRGRRALLRAGPDAIWASDVVVNCKTPGRGLETNGSKEPTAT